MTFRDFSKHLSEEIENLFATLGDHNLPKDVNRLDNSTSVKEMIEKAKNLDYSDRDDTE